MLKELACVGASVYVCLHAFIWGYCCGSLLFLLWLLGNAQTGQMCTFFGPSPMCRYSHHLGKNNRGKSTKINRVFTGFTVKVSNVLSQGWEERCKAGDVSMTKEVWVSYIKHLLPPLDPLIAHDCKQGSAKNLKKDESDPPLYEDHQSPAVSSLFISSSKAALFHFMDIMKAKMDISGKAV